jgi:putative ABC transport system permease protein
MVHAMAAMAAELRYAVRTLLAGRLFTTVAVMCLALGIATNTTMFSVFDAMFLRPLPFENAARLVSISGRHPETGRRVTPSLDDLRELRSAVHSVDAIGAYTGRAATLTDGGEPERIPTQLVTPNLFPVLGKHPQIGRGFDDNDDRPSSAGVALISDGLWRRRYGGDPSAVGRVIRLDGVPYTIVGVMPPRFRFPSTSELWIPITPALGPPASATRSISLIGRLAADAGLEAANAELSSHVLPARGSRAQRVPVARAYRSTVVGGEERIITGALMGATTVLLVIACVNLANLMLARGAGRRREIAVRASLGASRWRIVRQLLTESVLLAAVAGAVAIPLAWYGIRWIHDAVPPNDPLGPYYIDWSLDARTLIYATAIALITGVAFGSVPAWDAAGRRLLNPLRENAGAASGRVQRRVHNTLIVAQIALVVALLAGASLFVRTHVGLNRVELGYDMSHLMTMRFYLAGTAYDSAEARTRAVDGIARRLDGLGGAHAATVTDLVPLDDQGGSDAPAAVEGRTFAEGRAPVVHYAGVAGQWVQTLDVRVLDGRSFFDHELHDAAPVALVNARLAETFWPGEKALGRRFRFAGEESSPWLTVIGVVPDIRTVKLDESRATPPTAYVPLGLISTRNYGIIVRARSTPESVTNDVRAAVHAVDPSVALFDVYPMAQVRWLSYWMYIMWGTMFGVLGIIAVFIAAVGVYGVAYYTSTQRTREIGIRVALGAGRAQVVRPILRQSAILCGIGLAIGLLAARAVTPFVGSLLIGVSPNDPVALVAVAIVLAAVALVATWLPAWRASAIDPVVALREQ